MSGLTDILAERIEISVGPDARMGAYVARPTGAAPRPGVIVAHELFGVSWQRWTTFAPGEDPMSAWSA